MVRWFEEHHPEQGNFTHESDRDAIRAVLAKQVCGIVNRADKGPGVLYGERGTSFCGGRRGRSGRG